MRRIKIEHSNKMREFWGKLNVTNVEIKGEKRQKNVLKRHPQKPILSDLVD